MQVAVQVAVICWDSPNILTSTLYWRNLVPINLAQNIHGMSFPALQYFLLFLHRDTNDILEVPVNILHRREWALLRTRYQNQLQNPTFLIQDFLVLPPLFLSNVILLTGENILPISLLSSVLASYAWSERTVRQLHEIRYNQKSGLVWGTVNETLVDITRGNSIIIRPYPFFYNSTYSHQGVVHTCLYNNCICDYRVPAHIS